MTFSPETIQAETLVFGVIKEISHGKQAKQDERNYQEIPANVFELGKRSQVASMY